MFRLICLIIMITFVPMTVQGSECSEGLGKVLDYMEDAKKFEVEADGRYATAAQFRSERSTTTLPLAGTKEAEEWRSKLQYETSYYGMSAERLREAVKVYSDPGKQTWYRKNQARKTWFDWELSELLNNNQCIGERTEHKGKLVSIHYAAQLISKETDKQLQKWGERIRQLDSWARIDEASEILRIDPEHTKWCNGVVKDMAHPYLVKKFCSRLDGIGRTRLMPFIICKSNLSYYGFAQKKHSTHISYDDGMGMVDDFFTICSNENYLSQMTRNESFRRCMDHQARNAQESLESARRCYDDLNIATHGSAPRNSSPPSALEQTNNPNPSNQGATPI